MAGVPQRVSLITLGVADVAAATRFYTALGWTRSSASQEAITFLQLGGSGLALYGAEALAADVGLPSPPPGSFRGASMSINLASREEVDDVFARFVAAGGRALATPAAAVWGGYTSYVADPDGHVWEIAHNPFFPLGEDGSLTLPA
jgi:predicted lactoylglutathione lyase